MGTQRPPSQVRDGGPWYHPVSPVTRPHRLH